MNGWADEQPRDYEVLSRYSDGQNYALFPHNALDPKLLAGYQQADETIEQYDQSEDEGEEYDTVASQVATGSTPFLKTYEDPLRDSSAAETFQENVERSASQFEFTFSFPSPVQLDDAVRRYVVYTSFPPCLLILFTARQPPALRIQIAKTPPRRLPLRHLHIYILSTRLFSKKLTRSVLLNCAL